MTLAPFTLCSMNKACKALQLGIAAFKASSDKIGSSGLYFGLVVVQTTPTFEYLGLLWTSRSCCGCCLGRCWLTCSCCCGCCWGSGWMSYCCWGWLSCSCWCGAWLSCCCWGRCSLSCCCCWGWCGTNFLFKLLLLRLMWHHFFFRLLASTSWVVYASSHNSLQKYVGSYNIKATGTPKAYLIFFILANRKKYLVPFDFAGRIYLATIA